MFYHGGSSSSGGKCADAAEYRDAIGQLRRELFCRRRSSVVVGPPSGSVRSSADGAASRAHRDSSTVRRRRRTVGASGRSQHRRHQHNRCELASVDVNAEQDGTTFPATTSEASRLSPGINRISKTNRAVGGSGTDIDYCNSLAGCEILDISSPPGYQRQQASESPRLVSASSLRQLSIDNEIVGLTKSTSSVVPAIDEVFHDVDRCADNVDEDDELLVADVGFGGIGSGGRVVLNVGGTRHEVPWKTLARLPRSRLGRLATCRTRRELSTLCDDFDLSTPMPEFFFDRYPRSFASVLDFYRTGKLHVADESACVLAYGDDMSYWAIDELYMEACCQQRYQQRKDQVLDILRKELENLTLGTADGGDVNGGTDKKEPAFADNVNGTDQGSAVARWRRTVWNLMEKPQSSLSARVIHTFREHSWPCDTALEHQFVIRYIVNTQLVQLRTDRGARALLSVRCMHMFEYGAECLHTPRGRQRQEEHALSKLETGVSSVCHYVRLPLGS